MTVAADSSGLRAAPMIRVFKQFWRDLVCLILGHEWVEWGRRHCKRCGKIHAGDYWK